MLPPIAGGAESCGLEGGAAAGGAGSEGCVPSSTLRDPEDGAEGTAATFGAGTAGGAGCGAG